MALTLVDAGYVECEDFKKGKGSGITLFKKRYGTGDGGCNETCAHSRPDDRYSNGHCVRYGDGGGRPDHAAGHSIAGHSTASCTRKPVRENTIVSYHDIIVQRPRWLMLALVAVTLGAAGILVLSASGAHPYSLLRAPGTPVHLQRLQDNSPGYSNDRPVPIRAGQIYEVKRGDSIWSIAISLERGSVSKARKAASEMEEEVSGNALFPGESIRIPTIPSR
ncbi:MAG: LysM peptidoglycan-binding domain-containing protein [Acidimicrobiales bacterium]